MFRVLSNVGKFIIQNFRNGVLLIILDTNVFILIGMMLTDIVLLPY